MLVCLITVEIKDAYMSLEGGRDETGEGFDTRLLKEAQDNTQKISAMRYVAGAMTYKVNKMPDTKFHFNLLSHSSAFHVGRYLRESSLTLGVMEVYVLRLKKHFSLL